MDRRSLSVRAGLVAPPCAIVGVLLGALLDPNFSWWAGSLSHAGEFAGGWSFALVVDRPSVVLFNGGLILAGALGLPFAWLLYDDALVPLQRSGATALVVAFLGLLALGAYNQPSPYHVPAAIVTVLATTAVLWIYGAGELQVGRTSFGLGTVALGFVLVGTWLGWGRLAPDAGMAVPEFLVLASLCAWTFVAALREYEAAEGQSPLTALRSAVTEASAGRAE